MMLAALSPIIGHIFSPFLAFKGGKGVATALGSVLGLSPSIGALLLLIWLGAVAIWRYSSGGALAAFGLFPVVAIVNEQRQEFLIFAIVVSTLIWIKHKDNIVQFWKGRRERWAKRPWLRRVRCPVGLPSLDFPSISKQPTPLTPRVRAVVASPYFS